MALWTAINKVTALDDIRHIKDVYTQIEKALDQEKLVDAILRAKLIKK